MARAKQSTKAVTDSTANIDIEVKQTELETQNIERVNISPSQESIVKSDSMASQEQQKQLKPIYSSEKVGRPPIEIDYEKLEGFASQDIENYKIASAMGMSVSTFYRFMREDANFKEAYNKGMESRKYELEKALFRRATGFEGQEVVTEKDNEGNITKTKITDKMYVPDTTAAIFALKNVYSEKYKDRIETVTDINVNINQMQQLSNEELAKLVASNIVEADYSIE